VIAKLFEAIGSHLRDRTMFTLMLHAGLRVGEQTHRVFALHHKVSR
jgi:hypothetical protein